MVLNKSLQVRLPSSLLTVGVVDHTCVAGNQHPKHERGACCPDVQELPVQRALSFGRWMAPVMAV